MRAGARSGQNELTAIHRINQKPVGSDMTFPKTDIIACQGMITIFSRQRSFPAKGQQDDFQGGDINATFPYTFQIPAKLRGITKSSIVVLCVNIAAKLRKGLVAFRWTPPAHNLPRFLYRQSRCFIIARYFRLERKSSFHDRSMQKDMNGIRDRKTNICKYRFGLRFYLELNAQVDIGCPHVTFLLFSYCTASVKQIQHI